MSLLEPSTIERYEDLPSATSSSTGAVSIALRQVPVGTRCVFTVSVPGSSPLASWSIAKGLTGAAQTLMSWTGPTPVGPFTVDGPERLIVTGTNLSLSTPYQAIALGKRGPASLIDPEVPLGPPQTVALLGSPEVVLGTINYASPGPQDTFLTIPTGLRSVTLVCQSFAIVGQLQVSVTSNSIGYFTGSLPVENGPILGAYSPVIFAIDTTENQLFIRLQGGGGGGNSATVTVLGSTVDRAFALRPPGGMAPSASQFTTDAAIAPGLDRALWTARADCPRSLKSVTMSATNATLVAAPGASSRVKLYGCSFGTSSAAVGNGGCQVVIGGVNQSVGANLLQQTAKVYDFDGLEADANTAVTGLWVAGVLRIDLAYDIVPA